MNEEYGRITIVRGRDNTTTFLTRENLEELFSTIRRLIRNKEKDFCFQGESSRVFIVLSKVKYLSLEEKELYMFV